MLAIQLLQSKLTLAISKLEIWDRDYFNET